MIVEVGQRTPGPADQIDVGRVRRQQQDCGRARREPIQSGSTKSQARQCMGQVVQKAKPIAMFPPRADGLSNDNSALAAALFRSHEAPRNAQQVSVMISQ